MTPDPRLVALRLAGNWAGKVERDEITVDMAFDLLLERVGAIVPKFQACETCGQRPCPDPAMCASWREADRQITAGRTCAQCGAGGDLQPHRHREGRKLIYLHGECRRFWQVGHR